MASFVFGGEALDDGGKAAEDDFEVGVGGERLRDALEHYVGRPVSAACVDGEYDFFCHVSPLKGSPTG